MPQMPAARLTDMHVCPMVTGVVPHVGGPVLPTCSPNVLTGKLPQARVTDQALCVGPIDILVKGSPTVLVNKLPAVRIIVDTTAHGGMVVMGCFTVWIGDGGAGGSAGPAAALLDKIAQGKSGIKIEGTPEFQQKTLAALGRLAQTPTGLGLLQQLDASGKNVTIKETAAGNTENAANFGNGLYDKANGRPGPGTDSTVLWNPNKDTLGSGTEPWQTRDPAIGLGHELNHSYHDAYGTTNGDTSSYTGLDGNTYSAPGYEQQAVGFGPYQNDPYTENKLRQDFNDLGVSTKGKEAQRPRY